MNILFIIPDLNYGGAEKSVVMQANYFKKNGHDIHIVTLSNHTPLGKQLNNEIKIYNLGINKKISVKKISKLSKFISDNNIEVIHSHLFKADLLNFLTSFNTTKVKRYTTEHSSSSRRKKYKIFGWIQYLIYLRMSKVFAISREVRDHLLKWSKVPPTKVEILYNATDMSVIGKEELEAKLINKKENKKIVVGTIARLEERKDLLTALKAMECLINTYKINNLEYLIAGEGDKRSEIENFIKERKLDKQVRLLGHVDDIKTFIDTLDLHLITSKEESFGIVIIENMARGVPTIGTNVGGIPEVITDGTDGYLVDKGDYKSIAEKIADLIENEQAYKSISVNCLLKVKDTYSIEKNINKLMFIYRQY